MALNAYCPRHLPTNTVHGRADVIPNLQPAISVLIVEDEALLLFSAGDDLRDLGYTVYEARNADEAIVMLEAHPDITILFTDIDMPGSMDGLKLSAAVRNRWPPVKIIITSGKRRPDDTVMPIGGVFMPKPYMPAEVQKAIRSLMG